jgi:hypothetical protein
MDSLPRKLAAAGNLQTYSYLPDWIHIVKMPAKEEAPTYNNVLMGRDGALQCDCYSFLQTGKTCLHIAAVRLQLESGPVEDYIG